jgi:hypothetical protein
MMAFQRKKLRAIGVNAPLPGWHQEVFMIREPILRLTMRVSLSAFCLVIRATIVTVQTKSEDKKPGDSSYSTGRTVLPDNKGQLQPQRWTGPLSTGSEGAPA